MIVPATLFFAFVASAWAQAQINTPASLLQCQPALINWSGGQAPYFLSILPGGQASGTPLKQFDQTSDTSLTWVVDLAAGTAVTFQIRDNTGAVNFSDQVTIGEGVSADCLAAGSNTAASTVAGGAAGNTGASSSAATTSSSAQEEDSSSSAPASSSAPTSSMMTSSRPQSSSPAGSSTQATDAAQSAQPTAPDSGASVATIGKAVTGLAAIALGALLI